MFKIKAAQKKLLDKFVKENFQKITLFFDIDRARRSGEFPTLTDVYDQVAAIKDGDLLYATVNSYIANKGYDMRRAAI